MSKTSNIKAVGPAPKPPPAPANISTTSPWDVPKAKTDANGYLLPAKVDMAGANNTINSAYSQSQSAQGQIQSLQGQVDAYPAMENSYGLGAMNTSAGAIPGSSSNPDYAANPWGDSPADAGSRGFNPYSLKGEANYR